MSLQLTDLESRGVELEHIIELGLAGASTTKHVDRVVVCDR